MVAIEQQLTPGQEYIWVQPKNSRGYWRKVGAGKGTHKVARGYKTRAGRNVNPYIQKIRTETAPHVRVVAPDARGRRTQRVRGSVTRRSKGVSAETQAKYHRRFFTDEAVKKTRATGERGLWHKTRLAEEQRRQRAAEFRHPQTGKVIRTKRPEIIQGGYQRSKKHIDYAGNPNRTILGEADLQRILLQEEELHLAAGLEGAYDAGLEILEAARERIPMDTRYMADTGFVTAVKDGVIVGYGAHYAIYQHEILSYKHPVGEAKWLEKTVMDMPQEIVGHIYNGIRRLYGPHEFTAEGAAGSSTYGAAPWAQFGNPERFQWDPSLTPKGTGVRTRRTTSRRFRDELGF